MTVYGNPSRVSVDLQGGGIVSLNLDTAQKAVIFARGDPSSGSASTNDPTQVSGPGELEATFGADTPIVEHMRNAPGNGTGYDLLYGVMPATQSVTGEAVAGGSGTLGNAPLIEDLAEISVQNTTDGQAADSVAFRYDSPPTAPTAENEVHINPFTGEVEADDSDDYEVDYKYLDWQSAFDSATGVIEEQEIGVWGVDSEAEAVLNDAITTANPLREDEWKMVRVQGLAQPNANTEDNDAKIDVGNYSDNLDDDALFVFGPGRLENSSATITGALTGLMAGASISDPILGDTLSGIGGLEQTLTVPDQEDLEGKGVIPVSNAGAPSVEGNLSTSTESDWIRSYFARRLADRLILAARALGQATRGQLNNDNTAGLVERQLGDELLDFVDDGVLEPNVDGEDPNWFVNASEDPTDPRELDLAFGFTPVGVVDTVEIDATINY